MNITNISFVKNLVNIDNNNKTCNINTFKILHMTQNKTALLHKAFYTIFLWYGQYTELKKFNMQIHIDFVLFINDH